MSIQFRSRVHGSYEDQEYEKEITLLKGLNQALEKENDTRNEERKALQAQLDRLRRDNTASNFNAGLLGIAASSEYAEIQTLKEKYSEVRSKYENLLLENGTLTTRLSEIQFSSVERQQLNKQLKIYELRIQELETKLDRSEKEVFELRGLSKTQSMSSVELKESKRRVEELEREKRSLMNEAREWEDKCRGREVQLDKIKAEIVTYANKVEILKAEVTRLEETKPAEVVKYVEVEGEEMKRIKASNQTFGVLNAQLRSQNMGLRQQMATIIQELNMGSERTVSMERRVQILEETNASLEQELRDAIEAKKTASRITTTNEEGLRQRVTMLKSELDQMREFSHVIRHENEALQMRLHDHHHQTPRQQHHKVYNHKHAKGSQNRSRSRSPMQRSTTTATISSRGQPTSPFDVKSRYGERYNDLQRKIAMLQEENCTLKQQLIYYM